ncbi:MAG: hypothetical protein ABIG94_06995, partial [Pseudomonadota bacterium]
YMKVTGAFHVNFFRDILMGSFLTSRERRYRNKSTIKDRLGNLIFRLTSCQREIKNGKKIKN